jgi:hypothetical protein
MDWIDVVQFDNWPWPGIAIKGDEALSMARTLRAIAAGKISAETAALWLEGRALELERCEVPGHVRDYKLIYRRDD